MKNKFLLTAAAALAMTTVSSFAGLQLCASNNSNQVTVVCTDKTGTRTHTAPFIPANGCSSFGGVSDIPWGLIRAGLLQGDVPASCTFSMNGSAIGSGDLDIASDNSTGSLSNINIKDPTKFTVTFENGAQSGAEVKATINVK